MLATALLPMLTVLLAVMPANVAVSTMPARLPMAMLLLPVVPAPARAPMPMFASPTTEAPDKSPMAMLSLPVTD
ncbi:hypothetical protein D9M69_575950 [compost metagenome]